MTQYRNPALETIKAVGVSGLCQMDGCNCLSFAVHYVHVDVSCRKSSGGIGDGKTTVRVYSHHMDYDGHEPALRQIADEVVRQIAEWSGADPKEDFAILHEEYR